MCRPFYLDISFRARVVRNPSLPTRRLSFVTLDRHIFENEKSVSRSMDDLLFVRVTRESRTSAAPIELQDSAEMESFSW